ncbi:hypothetical protein GCM10010394_35320 [Streptomyces crystallinus]|uniref:Uncharacterized protein n=1 Tax=Streptomyces crystallinus TaxID=68191 RepID=A0ABP3R8G7_9ACTN
MDPGRVRTGRGTGAGGAARRDRAQSAADEDFGHKVQRATEPTAHGCPAGEAARAVHTAPVNRAREGLRGRATCPFRPLTRYPRVEKTLADNPQH